MPRITKIIHIADVHVSERVNTTGTSFSIDSLLATVRSTVTATDTPLIVVAGDVIDQAHKITHHILHTVDHLLRGLAAIGQTVVIPGNHDLPHPATNTRCVLAYITRGVPGCTYIIDDSVTVVGQITIRHVPWWSKQFTPIPFDQTDVAICVYHNAVSGALRDNGTQVRSSMHLHDIVPFDAILLGHLHLRQQFTEFNAVYPGSTFQLNHGNCHDKGFTVWSITDTNTLTPTHVPVPNTHAFVTVTDGELVAPLAPEVTHLSVRTRDRNSDAARRTRATVVNLADTFTLAATIDSPDTTPIARVSPEQLEVIRATHMDDTALLMTRMNLPPDDPQRDYIRGLHTRYAAAHPPPTHATMSDWKLLSVSGYNMFAYSNTILVELDLRTPGVTHITGANGLGKTSIVRLITFALFGPAPSRSHGSIKSVDVLNRQSTKMATTAIIQVGSADIYTIRRKGSRSGKVRVTMSVTITRSTVADPEPLGKIPMAALTKIIGTRKEYVDSVIVSNTSTNMTTFTPAALARAIGSIVESNDYIAMRKDARSERKRLKEQGASLTTDLALLEQSRHSAAQTDTVRAKVAAAARLVDTLWATLSTHPHLSDHIAAHRSATAEALVESEQRRDRCIIAVAATAKLTASLDSVTTRLAATSSADTRSVATLEQMCATTTTRRAIMAQVTSVQHRLDTVQSVTDRVTPAKLGTVAAAVRQATASHTLITAHAALVASQDNRTPVTTATAVYPPPLAEPAAHLATLHAALCTATTLPRAATLPAITARRAELRTNLDSDRTVYNECIAARTLSKITASKLAHATAELAALPPSTGVDPTPAAMSQARQALDHIRYTRELLTTVQIDAGPFTHTHPMDLSAIPALVQSLSTAQSNPLPVILAEVRAELTARGGYNPRAKITRLLLKCYTAASAQTKPVDLVSVHADLATAQAYVTDVWLTNGWVDQITDTDRAVYTKRAQLTDLCAQLAADLAATADPNSTTIIATHHANQRALDTFTLLADEWSSTVTEAIDPTGSTPGSITAELTNQLAAWRTFSAGVESATETMSNICSPHAWARDIAPTLLTKWTDLVSALALTPLAQPTPRSPSATRYRSMITESIRALHAYEAIDVDLVQLRQTIADLTADLADLPTHKPVTQRDVAAARTRDQLLATRADLRTDIDATAIPHSTSIIARHATDLAAADRAERLFTDWETAAVGHPVYPECTTNPPIDLLAEVIAQTTLWTDYTDAVAHHATTVATYDVLVAASQSNLSQAATITQCTAIRATLDNLSTNTATLVAYIAALAPDKLPNDVTEAHMRTINGDMNAILSAIDGNVCIHVAPKSITFDKGGNTLPISSAGGYEMFIFNLSIMLIIRKYSSTASSDMLIIDDALGRVDDANLRRVAAVVNGPMLSSFKTLLITHSDRYSGMATTTRTVVKSPAGTKLV